jgi:hypothetical protein
VECKKKADSQELTRKDCFSWGRPATGPTSAGSGDATVLTRAQFDSVRAAFRMRKSGPKLAVWTVPKDY